MISALGPDALTVDGVHVSSEDVGRAAYSAICQIALTLRNSDSPVSDEILDLFAHLGKKQLLSLFRDFAIFFTEFYSVDRDRCVYVDTVLLMSKRFHDLDCLVCRYLKVLDEQAPGCDVIVDTAGEEF